MIVLAIFPARAGCPWPYPPIPSLHAKQLSYEPRRAGKRDESNERARQRRQSILFHIQKIDHPKFSVSRIRRAPFDLPSRSPVRGDFAEKGVCEKAGGGVKKGYGVREKGGTLKWGTGYFFGWGG